MIKPVVAQTFTDCMEQLQEGYVASVAATAGCSFQPVSRDTYGMDVLLTRPGKLSLEEASVYLQLKNTTTIKPVPATGQFSYQFKKRLYLERLAQPRKNIKALLIVMATSPEQARWSSATHDHLEVSHACYWKNLEGYPVPDGVVSPSVTVPTAQIFDAAALTDILDRLERGDELDAF